MEGYFVMQAIWLVTIKELRFIKKKLRFLFYSGGIIPGAVRIP